MFIVVEGIDGSGKTTFSNALVKRLREIYGKNVIKTREPYTFRPEELKGLSPEEIYAKFIEDRREHNERIIKPAVESGKIVVCDRYWQSSYVYQSIMGINKERIIIDNVEFLQPDVLILLDPPTEVIRQRLAINDQLDEFAISRIQQIKSLYREVAEISEELGTKVVIIDDGDALKYIEDFVFGL